MDRHCYMAVYEWYEVMVKIRDQYRCVSLVGYAHDDRRVYTDEKKKLELTRKRLNSEFMKAGTLAASFNGH